MAQKILRSLAATLLFSIIFQFDSVEAQRWDLLCSGAKTAKPSDCWWMSPVWRDIRCLDAKCPRKYKWEYKHQIYGTCHCCECWEESKSFEGHGFQNN